MGLTCHRLAQQADLAPATMKSLLCGGRGRLRTLDAVARTLQAQPASLLAPTESQPLPTLMPSGGSSSRVLAQNLRRWLRGARHRSPDELSGRVSFSRATTYRLFDPTTDAHSDQLAEVAAALGVPAWRLVVPYGGTRATRAFTFESPVDADVSTRVATIISDGSG